MEKMERNVMFQASWLSGANWLLDVRGNSWKLRRNNLKDVMMVRSSGFSSMIQVARFHECLKLAEGGSSQKQPPKVDLLNAVIH